MKSNSLFTPFALFLLLPAVGCTPQSITPTEQKATLPAPTSTGLPVPTSTGIPPAQDSSSIFFDDFSYASPEAITARGCLQDAKPRNL